MKLVVLGGGESGVGTALLGKKKGYEVFLSDFGKIKQNYKDVLIQNEISWEEEKHTEEKILNADVVMKSPGIPDKAPIVKKLKEKGIGMLYVLESASRFSKAYTVAITRRTGGTAIAALEHHLMRCAELCEEFGGNTG